MGYLTRTGFWVADDRVKVNAYGVFVYKDTGEPATQINEAYKEYVEKMSVDYEFDNLDGWWIRKY